MEKLKDRDKKFLIAGLIIIIILFTIFFIFIPAKKSINEKALISEYARLVESHVKNIQISMMSEVFESGNLNMSVYDNASTYRINSLAADDIKCNNYKIKDGEILSAKSCSKYDWKYIYDYTSKSGAELVKEK